MIATITGLALGHFVVGSVFGGYNQRVMKQWKTRKYGEKPVTAVEMMLFPVTGIARASVKQPIAEHQYNDIMPECYNSLKSETSQKHYVMFISLLWPIKALWCAGVLAGLGIYYGFQAMTWNISSTVFGASDLVTSIPERLRQRKLRKIERARKQLDAYANAAGIGEELAASERLALLEKQILAHECAGSDLRELHRRLVANSEAWQEVAHIGAPEGMQQLVRKGGDR